MKNVQTVFAVFLFAYVLFIGSSAPAGNAVLSPVAATYDVQVHEFEGCECDPVCPCIFSRDTSFGDCRGITVFTFNGRYGATKLKDLSCALVFTWVGRNMEGTMGKWKGLLYTPDTITPAERAAIDGLLRVMMGDAFVVLEKREAPIHVERKNDVHDITIGKVGRLRIHGMKGQSGKVAKVVDAPSPIAYQTMYCAIADIHTYDDGKASWDFSGKNGFFADFSLSSAK